MIVGLIWLLAAQLVGEVVVRALGVSIPGPVVGMALLFGMLVLRRPGAMASTLDVADLLLRHLQLLFVPAGVGVVAYGSTLRHDALPIAVGLVGSWAVGLGVVAGTIALLDRRRS